MNDLLHRLALPAVFDAAEHAHAGIAHAAEHGADTAGPAALWPLAAAAALFALAGWLAARQLGRSGHLPRPKRWAAGLLLTAWLLALPLLSLHATHHLDGDDDGHCAVAGIAHSIAGGVVAAAPALVAPPTAAPVPTPFLAAQPERATPSPIARGPPDPRLHA